MYHYAKLQTIGFIDFEAITKSLDADFTCVVHSVALT